MFGLIVPERQLATFLFALDQGEVECHTYLRFDES